MGKKSEHRKQKLFSLSYRYFKLVINESEMTNVARQSTVKKVTQKASI